MRFADLILAEIMTPTGQTGPLGGAYLRAVSGMGHAVLGAAFCALLGLWGLGATWYVKESGTGNTGWVGK